MVPLMKKFYIANSHKAFKINSHKALARRKTTQGICNWNMKQPLCSQCCNNFSFFPYTEQVALSGSTFWPQSLHSISSSQWLIWCHGSPQMQWPLGWPWSPIVPGWVIAGSWLSFGCTFVGSSGWPLGLVPHVAGGHSGCWAQWLQIMLMV